MVNVKGWHSGTVRRDGASAYPRFVGFCVGVSTSSAVDPRKKRATVAGPGLVEDRLEMVLDGVLGDEHRLGDGPCVWSVDKSVDNFGLPR